MKEFRLGKDALILAIMTLITAMTWVGLEVYRVSIKTTIPKITQEQMQSMDSSLDTKVIEDLKADLSFSDEELNLSSLPLSTESATENQ